MTDPFEQLAEYKDNFYKIYSHESISKIVETKEYRALSDDLTELCATMAIASEPVDGVTPPLDRENYDILQQQYANLTKSLNHFGTFAIQNKTPEMATAVAGLNRLVKQDSAALAEVTPNGRDTLSRMLVKCRNIQVDVPAGTAVKYEEGAMSARMPIRFNDASGKPREGFFTQDSKVLPSAEGDTANRNMVDHGIVVGSLIAERNVAMSRMASMTGTSHVLAQSVKMQATMNGETLDGVFMDTAKGEDLHRLSLEMAERLGNVTYTPEVLCQIADMQMLDAICTNCDRHEGNMLYQLEPTEDGVKLTGVVGIDNDLSFTGRLKQNFQHIDNQPFGLNRVNVCSTSMAQKLTLMDRNAFDLSMQDIQLDKKEKDVAWRNVQKAQDYIAKKKILVIPDGDFAEPKYQERLYQVGKNKAFSTVKGALQRNYEMTLPGSEIEREPSGQVQYADVDFVSNGELAMRELTAHTTEQMISMKEKLNETKSRHRPGSKAFKAMMSAMDEVTPPNAISQEGLEKLNETVKSYADYKKHHLMGNTAKTRFALITSLGDTLDHSLKQMEAGKVPRQVKAAQVEGPQRIQVGLDALRATSPANTPKRHSNTKSKTPVQPQKTRSGPGLG